MAQAPDAAAASDLSPQDAARAFQRACLLWAAVVIALAAIVVVLPLASRGLTGLGPSVLFFWMQDIRIVPLLLLTLALAPLLVRRTLIDDSAPALAGPLPPWGVALAIALALGAVGWIGHYLVFDHYDLSRDEQMATFDAWIFAHGRLMWPIPAVWRPFADALNQTFILPIGAHDAWVSAYLPVNAAFRALAGRVGDSALSGPVFVATGALALWRITLRLWPASASTRRVVLILYAGSAQIVLTSMTAYAMSAHLCLDLVWLALFLRGGVTAHGAAAAIGFLATGLHQPLFHPFFVLPFLDLLRHERWWRPLAFYVVAYGLIGLFWLDWPVWISGRAHHAGGGVGYLERLLQALHVVDLKSLLLTTLNLLRFATWQHLLLLPLLGLGLGLVRRDPLVRALAIGLALPIVVMAILLPLQGHGWGYRYVAGVLGNACLLAGYGWHRLEKAGLDLRRAFAIASVATFAVVIPAYAFLAHRWVAPYAAAVRAMEATGADIVVVENDAAPWGNDLVLDRPDVGNRPVRLLASALRPQDMATLCRHGSIAFFDRARLATIRQAFGLGDFSAPTNERALEAAARAAGCTIVTDKPGGGP